MSGSTVARLIPGGPDITPDDFDWYFYKGRVVGIQEDLTCNSICNGKLLLGSFMKKPLWVDHSANTVSMCPVPRSISPLLFFKSRVSSSQVFNLLTSSVKVSVNGRESHFTPAQSFMVQSGESPIVYGRIPPVPPASLLMPLVSSHRRSLQRPEPHHAARCPLLHQDIC